MEWDWTDGGSTKGVRTDDAALFSDPSPAVSNGTGSSPFDRLYPWSGMVRETRDGGVEVKEPKYWFKWTKTGKKMKLQIADGPVDGFSVDPVHRDRGDGRGERDLAYIGRYHCGSDYKSTSGAAPQRKVAISDARSGIHDLGSNFWQMDFSQYWYVNMLFLVEFADFDGDRIGVGVGTGGNNGLTDSMQYHTGTTASSRDSMGATQYRNIECWWGNVLDWVDGCYCNSDGLHIINDPNNFSDSSNGVCVGKLSNSAGFPSDLAIPTVDGLEWALYPSERVYPATSVCIPDVWWPRNTDGLLSHGADSSSDSFNENYGPFTIGFEHAAVSSTGCRLQELL